MENNNSGKSEYTKEKLSDKDRKELNDALKKAFFILRRIDGLQTEKAEKLMTELNKLHTEANQVELLF